MASKHQSSVIKKLKAEGWYVVKLIKTNKNGIPDLLCLKNGVAKFIECKEKADTLDSLQEFRIKELRKLGFEAIVDKAK
jgi:Holliday junction resolvase